MAQETPPPPPFPPIFCNGFIEIEFTYHTLIHVKCGIPSLVYSQSCRTIGIIREHFRPLREKRLQPSPPSSHLPQAPSTTACFLSLWTCINGITHYVAFCDWLLSLGIMFFSGFIHIVTFIISFWPKSIPWCGYATFYLLIYPSMGQWFL